MNLYHLRYFVTLAQMEHYTKAADVLGITQPSLSYAITSIEDELGIKLFEKNGRNIALTNFGQIFLKDIEGVLAILDQSVNRLQMAGKGNGAIGVAFLRTLGINLVPELIQKFLKEHPDRNIQFDLHCDQSLSADIIEGLKDKKYEIAFCSRIKNESSVVYYPVLEEELVMIVPKDHPLAAKDSVTLQETMNYKHIIFKKKSGLYHIISSMYMDTCGSFPEVALEVEEDQVAAGFVSNGFGIAIVPNMTILETLNVKILKLTGCSYERKFYMAMLKDAYHSPVVEAFRDFVLDHVNPDLL